MRAFAEESTCLIFGNVWAKTMTFAHKGDEKTGHSHDFDHMTIIGRGGFQVSRILPDGSVRNDFVYAPGIVEVPKGESHSLIALEDNSVAFCIETTVLAKDAVDR